MKTTLFLISSLISIIAYSQNTFVINNVKWSTENLSASKFNNGEPIFQAKTDSEWKDVCLKKKPAFYEVINESGKKEKLYNYYALIDKRGILPKGTRYPNGMEFMSMSDFFSNDASQVKSMNFVLAEMIYLTSCNEIRREKAVSFWYLDPNNMPISDVLKMNVGPSMSLSSCPNQEKTFPLCDGSFFGFESLSSIGMAELGNGMLVRLVLE
jgi:hypothetical protein